MRRFCLLVALFAAVISVCPAQAHAQQKRVLMVVTGAKETGHHKPTGLWLEEYAVPYLLFEKAGYSVTVASLKGGKTPIDPRSLTDAAKVYGWAGAIVHLDDTAVLRTVGDADYDAIFIPGGHGAVFDLPNAPDLMKVLNRMSREGKVISAVCHGPAGFVGAKQGNGAPLVNGKKMTSFTDDEEKTIGLDHEVPFLLESTLKKEGARFVEGKKWGSHIEVDGKFATGQNPASSEAVAKAVIELLK